MSAVPGTPAVPAADERAGRPERAVAGTARLGRRTKMLTKHLVAGDIAVIDHKDLDRVSAEDLVAVGVRGVLNCRPSSSGGAPNLHPLLLLHAGVPPAHP